MAIVELIRLEPGGAPPLVLDRIQWSGAEPPTQAIFVNYAATLLQSFYEPNSGQPKPAFRGRPVPDAVRFMDDDGVEQWRYTLDDDLRTATLEAMISL